MGAEGRAVDQKRVPEEAVAKGGIEHYRKSGQHMQRPRPGSKGEQEHTTLQKTCKCVYVCLMWWEGWVTTGCSGEMGALHKRPSNQAKEFTFLHRDQGVKQKSYMTRFTDLH